MRESNPLVLNSKIRVINDQAETNYTSALKWYDDFTKSKKLSRVLADYHHALLPQFEHYLIGNKKLPSLLISFKALFSIGLKDESSSLKAKDNTVYFWPFQFLHCDFQELLYKHLKKEKINIEAIVFRPNLVDYLSEKGIDSIFAKNQRKWKNPFDAIKCLITICIDLFRILFSKAPWQWKKATIATFAQLSLLRKVRAACHSVFNERLHQYHVVGYDLSALGRMIIAEANKRNLPTGRIQNGAPNYLICGFSEVTQLFAWDEETERAYKSKGYAGDVVITGNILLQEKYPKENVFPQMEPILISQYAHRILVAFSGPGHNTSEIGHQKTLETLEAIVSRCSEVLFVIKLHPKDKLSYYANFAQYKNVKMAQALFPDKMPNAIQFLHATQFLITGASSVALDALNLGRYVISIDPLEELDHFEFLRQTKVIRVRNDKEVEASVDFIKTSIEILKPEEVYENGLQLLTEHIRNTLEL